MNRHTHSIRRALAALLALALMAAAVPAALAEDFSAVVTAKSMAVYRDADMTDRMGALRQYTVVRVSGYQDGVARITYNGITGYAASASMDTVEAFAKKALLVATSKIYSSPSRTSDHVLGKKGLRLYVLAEKNGWALVELDGNVGYVETDRLLKATQQWKVAENTSLDEDIEYQAAALSAKATGKTYTVKKQTTLYKTPTTKGKKLATLKRLTKVSVLASNKTWAYVKVGSRKGYVQLKYLKKGTISTTAKAVGKVKVSKLPVYKTASTRSKLLGTMKKGTRVNMIRWNSRWAYIELNGRRGFTATAGLKRIANVNPSPEPSVAPTPEPSLDNAIKAVVSASSVTVYKKASTSSAKLGTLKKGTKLNLLAATGKWARVELSGKYGYCLLSALTKLEDETDIPKGFTKKSTVATVITSGARAYSLPNTAASSLPLGLGATVKVVAVSDSWACVNGDGTYAFVPLGQLSDKAYDSPKDGDAAVKTMLRALLNLGYFDGVPSTDLDGEAEAAVNRFQKACGLNPTGSADRVTLQILYGGYAPRSGMLSTPLSKGAKSASVTRLQTRLLSLGYLSLTASVDGDYGSITANAVTLFQKANGLVTTGGADAATLKVLYSTAAKKLPSGSRAADASSGGNPGGGTSTYMLYMPGNTASKVTKYSASMSNAKKLEYAIYVASTKLGCPYVYGAVGPSRFDCSGLTLFCMNKIGVSLERTAYSQGYNSKYTKLESVSALKRGDLVFFNTVSDSDLCDHVGIYLGDGYFIHASSGGHKVVCSQLRTGFYNRVFSWGRRILK